MIEAKSKNYNTINKRKIRGTSGHFTFRENHEVIFTFLFTYITNRLYPSDFSMTKFNLKFTNNNKIS